MSCGRVVAVVEALCGSGIAVWFTAIGAVERPGVRVTALPADTDHAALGVGPGDREWVDEQRPHAAGEEQAG